MSDSIIKTGKDIILAESAALAELSEILDENFAGAVNLILELSKTGHVIISGMGKAGLIGTKVSATFASIGVPSFFLHPAEALHGDIGRYSKDDLAIIFSNSGETDELVKSIPAIKRIGTSIIAITANSANTLAKHSDIVLKIGTGSEAGPLGLAPTTSTAKMLAMGDALAMAVLQEKNLSPQDFAFYHPGGNLGRSLITVAEIMRKNEKLCIMPESASIKEVIASYSATEGRPGAAVIINTDKKLAGIFTDGDLRRCLENNTDLNSPVNLVMGKKPKTISPESLAAEALQILSLNKIDQVIATDRDNQPVGIIDIQDVCFLMPT